MKIISDCNFGSYYFRHVHRQFVQRSKSIAVVWYPDHYYRDIACFDCSLETLTCARIRFVVYKIDQKNESFLFKGTICFLISPPRLVSFLSNWHPETQQTRHHSTFRGRFWTGSNTNTDISIEIKLLYIFLQWNYIYILNWHKFMSTYWVRCHFNSKAIWWHLHVIISLYC